MVHTCCVDACCNTKRPNLVFHRFPVGDQGRLWQWLFALNMDVNTPLHILNKLFVCQKHFQPDDYYDPSGVPSRRARLLRATAVPTMSRHTHTPETGDLAASTMYLDQLVSYEHTCRTGPAKQPVINLKQQISLHFEW